MRILGVTAAVAATLIGAIGLAGVANADPARPLPFTTVDIDVSCSDDH